MGINKERAAKSRELKNAKPANDEDVELVKLKDARFDAEQRFRKLLDRRNALNDEARQAREARDAINGERRRIYTEVEAMMQQRQSIAGEIKTHKQARNEAQNRARQLIAIKQEKRKGAVGGALAKVRELDAAIKALEFKQQTVPMSGPKELELLDEIKGKVKELEESRKVADAQKLILGDIQDLDAAITEAFAKADAAHAEVVRLSNAWQELTNKLEPAFQELGHLKSEADKRHQQFLDLRKRADEEHAKAGELRGEVDARHADVEKVFQERKQVMRDIRQQARALDDPNARDAVADEAVKLLLEKGRVTLG
jgi:uncharacterized coiled-coil DUF342 family protein